MIARDKMPESVSDLPPTSAVSVKSSAASRTSWVAALLPTAVILGALALWALVTGLHWVPAYDLPSPLDTAKALAQEARSGQLLSDTIASLYRVAFGFVLSAVFGIPLGLWLGQRLQARLALLPLVNFFRCLSPLAWIPFAILWFGIGDLAAIFLIFMASFFPLALATMAAVSEVPTVYARVARDYGFRGAEMMWKVIFPAVLPQIITALRVTAGIAWVVVVAAEMVGCQSGLGYGIYDARYGERMDMVVAYMIVIGLLGVAIDRALTQLSRLPSVRWGYDR